MLTVVKKFNPKQVYWSNQDFILWTDGEAEYVTDKENKKVFQVTPQAMTKILWKIGAVMEEKPTCIKPLKLEK